MVNTEEDLWHWHHSISECYYHIQLTVKYRKSMLNVEVEKVILEIMRGLKERYTIDIQTVGFDKNHIHFLCRFLPTYSGGQVVKVVKSLTAKEVFKQVPSIKNQLWGGEFWTDGYYISTISGRGSKDTIEKYIANQGRKEDVKQLKLFEL